MEDHVYLLIQLPLALSLAMAVSTLKSNSSSWMSEHGSPFAWQEGYGAFSVSKSNVNRVIEYIRDQETHHKKTTFEEEFIAFLKKHGIGYDLRYVFD